MGITQFDIEHIEEIISGNTGNWFTAKLLRLMADADNTNLFKLAYVYPEEFVEFANWKYGGVPTRFVTVDSVRNLMSFRESNAVLDEKLINWITPEGKTTEVILTHGRDF